MDDEALNAKLTEVDRRFTDVDRRFEKLEDLIRSEGASTRRHFDVVAARFDVVAARFDVAVENMKSDIQLVAEGHGALVESIADVKGGIKRLEAGQISLVLRTSALESRLTSVEKTQKGMLAELRGLASRR